jgi:CRISPR-associated protein Cas2
MRWLLSYDIACPRRRTRAVKILLGHGWRQQESVFVLELKDADWMQLKRQIDSIIDPKADHWRAWPLCRRDADDRHDLGLPPPPITSALVVI